MPLYSIGKKIVERYVNAGYTAYFAGGWVRDYLMKHPSDDIDIVTNAPVEVTESLFAKTIPVGISFGIIVIVEEGHPFEVATFRKESDHKDGRRPGKIEPATPEEDAKRRDFTINGMFFDPLTETLYDYVNGRSDLQKEIIRAIGNPSDRFLEDRLRMIRAIRYAARFGFAIDPLTIEAILEHKEELFPSVAVERIYQELIKMAKFPRFDEALLLLYKFGLLSIIFPSLPNLSLEELEKNLSLLPSFPPSAPLISKLYELFPTASLEEKLALCDYFKLSKNDRVFTTTYEALKTQKPSEAYDWAELYALPHLETALEILALKHPPSWKEEHLLRKQHLAPHILRIQQHKTLVTAHHLETRGIKPGKEMGLLLKQAERLAVNQNLTTPEEVLPLLFKNFSKEAPSKNL